MEQKCPVFTTLINSTATTHNNTVWDRNMRRPLSIAWTQGNGCWRILFSDLRDSKARPLLLRPIPKPWRFSVQRRILNGNNKTVGFWISWSVTYKEPARLNLRRDDYLLDVLEPLQRRVLSLGIHDRTGRSDDEGRLVMWFHFGQSKGRRASINKTTFIGPRLRNSGP